MFGKTVSLIDLADHDLKAWPTRPFTPSRTSPPPRRPTAEQHGVHAPFDKLPRDLQAAREWALKQLFDELDSLNAEQALAVTESERATLAKLYSARHDPKRSPLKIPIVVLSRGRETAPKISAMQDELARLSSDTIHRIAANSGEQIQIEQPDLVSSAVAEIVQAIRAGKPLDPAPQNH
jgi:hypothetical protein